MKRIRSDGTLTGFQAGLKYRFQTLPRLTHFASLAFAVVGIVGGVKSFADSSNANDVAQGHKLRRASSIVSSPALHCCFTPCQQHALILSMAMFLMFDMQALMAGCAPARASRCKADNANLGGNARSLRLPHLKMVLATSNACAHLTWASSINWGQCTMITGVLMMSWQHLQLSTETNYVMQGFAALCVLLVIMSLSALVFGHAKIAVADASVRLRTTVS